MTCDVAIERILMADPAELSGEAATPLGEHLRACPRCRALADEVLEGQAALAAWLEAAGPRTELDEALRAIRTAQPGEGPAAEAGGTPRWGRRWRWAWAALPAAAAAVLAGLLLADAGKEPGPVVVTPAETRPAGAVRRHPVSARVPARTAEGPGGAPRPPRVTAPPDGGMAVIRTANPLITVVWIESDSD